MTIENLYTPTFRFFDGLFTTDDAASNLQKAADEIAAGDPHGVGDAEKAIGDLQNEAADAKAEADKKAEEDEEQDSE